jgi:hypothetical protein
LFEDLQNLELIVGFNIMGFDYGCQGLHHAYCVSSDLDSWRKSIAADGLSRIIWWKKRWGRRSWRMAFRQWNGREVGTSHSLLPKDVALNEFFSHAIREGHLIM